MTSFYLLIRLLSEIGPKFIASVKCRYGTRGIKELNLFPHLIHELKQERNVHSKRIKMLYNVVVGQWKPSRTL